MNFELDGLHRPVIVVGGGQAGLSMSHCLTSAGVGHLVLERERAGHEWRTRRWDSFCLVTPNWQCRLPGFPYAGDDPDGFMVRDEIVAYLESYVKAFDVPLCEGVEAKRLRQLPGGGFRLTTSAGELTADHVVLATGPYQVPLKPRLAERLPEHVFQLHSADYRNPDQLPAGDVLVVGTGQSGCQIAEDLHLAGRRVHLAVGSAPRVARRYRGRDVVAWLDEMGYYDRGIDEFADADAVRFRANHYVTGRDGGRDLDLRLFASQGMSLHGLLVSVDGGVASFADDLKLNLDVADATYNRINAGIDRWISRHGIDTEQGPSVYEPVWQPPPGPPAPLDLGAAGITSVVWCTGFRPDWSWVDVPFLDENGYPEHERGVVAASPGLYVLGLPWLHTWGSGRFAGVARDAEHVAGQMVGAAVG
jgi:putative flavoprotein involved in K+ transport